MGKENKSRFAILGMLSLAPMSGYDLRKAIEYSVRYFWNESYPQIYPMLKQLTEEELTTSTINRQQGKPDRYVYALTDKGWAELEQWLSEPFEYQVPRNELLLKLFFGGHVHISVSIEHVQHHRTIQEHLLQVYQQTEEEVRVSRADHSQLPYWLLTISFGKRIAQAMLDWCDEAMETLERINKEQEDRKRLDNSNTGDVVSNTGDVVGTNGRPQGSPPTI